MMRPAFPQFSLFPFEIRKLIWEMSWQSQAEATSRIVYLEMVSTHDDEIWRFASQRTFPLFSACIESAMVGEKMYPKSFGTADTPPSTPFSFELDTLYLGWGCRLNIRNQDHGTPYYLDEILSVDAEKVSKLAIYIDGPFGGMMAHRVFCKFRNLRTITLIAPYHDHQNKDCSKLAFLDHSDALEDPEYHIYPDNDPYHPVLDEFIQRGDLQTEAEESLWMDEAHLSGLILQHKVLGAEWTKPSLQRLPVMTIQRRLEFLRRKEEFNATRKAHRTEVTLTSKNYDTLELSVPLSTIVGDMVTTFCETRGIERVDVLRDVEIIDKTKARAGFDGHVGDLQILYDMGYLKQLVLDLVFLSEEEVEIAAEEDYLFLEFFTDEQRALLGLSVPRLV